MLNLPKPALFMAPMVDLSHVAYRELIRSFGGCDLFYSEMLNSRILPSDKPETSIYLRWAHSDDLIFQILGNDPDKMQQAALKLDTYNPWGIDINMGCWLKKVTVHGWGAALMKDMDRAREVVSAVRQATAKPVSVKLRIGYELDMKYLLDFAAMLEDTGTDFLVLHARTVLDGMSRKARWEYIAALKEHVSVPVIGNGDVSSAQDACSMMRQTGCDGVMIGRQALIQPWIFRDAKALFTGRQPDDVPKLKEVILALHALLERHFSPEVALKRFKTALFWLAQNLSFGHFLTKQGGRAKSMDEAKVCITNCFESGIS
jgi:tRNA-dihydrouridine synthase B